jgi:uncharacterized protein (DUF58 family)
MSANGIWATLGIGLLLLLGLGLFANNMRMAVMGWLEHRRLKAQMQVAEAWQDDFEGLRSAFERVKQQFDTKAASLHPRERGRRWEPVDGKIGEALTALMEQDLDTARAALLEATARGQRIIAELA